MAPTASPPITPAATAPPLPAAAGVDAPDKDAAARPMAAIAPMNLIRLSLGVRRANMTFPAGQSHGLGVTAPRAPCWPAVRLRQGFPVSPTSPGDEPAAAPGIAQSRSRYRQSRFPARPGRRTS